MSNQDYPEKPLFTINYTINSISFACRECGNNLVMKKRSLEVMASGIFCNGCHEHYWINWSEGVLRNSKYQEESLDDD